MDLVIWYVSNLFFPNKVIFLWSALYGQEHLWRNVMIFILAFGAGVYAFFQWKRSWQSLLLMIFVLGFLPTVVSCFPDFPECRPMIEPHWFYFSQIGFFVLAGWFLLTMARKNSLVGRVFSCSVILSLLICCWHYNSEWRTQEKYSLYWLNLNKGNLTPYYGLGRSLMDKGDYLGAKNCFLLEFKRLNYWSLEMSADLGHCYDMLGLDEDALLWLNRAVNWSDQYALSYHYFGLYYNRRGNFIEAQKAFKKAVELDPKFSPSRAYLKS
jgi:tetratricopeptide (TPR) repeat protein